MTKILSPGCSFKGLDWMTFIQKNKKYIKAFLAATVGLASYAAMQLPPGWRELVSGVIATGSLIGLNLFDAFVTEIHQE